MSESLKETIYVQDAVEFMGMGKLQIQVCTDASVAKSFVHRLGVGRMKHLDVRLCYLQVQQAKGIFVCKKVPRDVNPADLLTHAPTAKELEKFLPMLGIFPLDCSNDIVEMVRNALAVQPQLQPNIAAAILRQAYHNSK